MNCGRLTMPCVLFLMASCGDGVGPGGEVVGGACRLATECAAGSYCETSGDFPGGTCTVRCRSEAECPGGTACVSKAGGICLLACQYPQDCRPGYTCKGESRESGGGDALVCIKD